MRRPPRLDYVVDRRPVKPDPRLTVALVCLSLGAAGLIAFIMTGGF